MLFHRLWTSCFFNPFANIFGEQWLRLTCLFVPTQVIGFPAFLKLFVAALPCIIFLLNGMVFMIISGLLHEKIRFVDRLPQSCFWLMIEFTCLLWIIYISSIISSQDFLGDVNGCDHKEDKKAEILNQILFNCIC